MTAPRSAAAVPRPLRTAAGAAGAAAGAVGPRREPLARPAPAPGHRGGRAARPQLVVVPDPGARQARRLARLATAVLATVACVGLFGVISVQVLLAEGQAGVADLDARLDAGQEQVQLLRTDVARMESPAIIVAQARERLGMVEPETVTLLEPLAGNGSESASTGPAVSSAAPASGPAAR